MKNNFLITTGGSGGHVLPATIFFDHLSKEGHTLITTDKRGSKYLDKDHYQFKIIDTPKLSKRIFLPINLIIILFLTLKSFFLIKKKKINNVISTGGYMSLPIILAAKLLGLKIFLLEPNQVLGRANRYFLNSCVKIFCYSNQIKNFPEKFRNKMVVINPLVKKDIYKVSLTIKDTDKFSLLVVGGSQGAEFFDKNLKNFIYNISKQFPIKIIQQTSKRNISLLEEFYNRNNIENIIFSFHKNFTQFIQQADLCITRAGASTLAELSVLNTPFIAVPLPTSKDNHQFENANYYRNNGCCWILEQSSFENKIEEVLKDIIDNKSEYLKKKENLKKLNFQNSWINVNQKLLKSINEN
ncbi:UDP-N-acetylglucosamine--N-acetylmuramyl-(pentapeptide) pyrophosphoryl-undecaprenol N-acetylglucosamine transferase [Candidatus Pelagibacter sp.]|nr:UDP-N-acetylglucosamine--N-acetylmuramyl-(pentapeptide) pyrophosphoryl-undecaprenol N-acetylglucosamine transferase [Candidatus Pelagibacter sp.]